MQLTSGADFKPENILLDWHRDETGGFVIERVVLSNLDFAFRVPGNQVLLKYKRGSPMWRSPEGQAGRMVGKPSEVFSFGLVVSGAPDS